MSGAGCDLGVRVEGASGTESRIASAASGSAGFLYQLLVDVPSVEESFNNNEQALPFALSLPQFADGPFLCGIRSIGDMRPLIFDDE